MTDNLIEQLKEGVVLRPKRWSGDTHYDLGGSADEEATDLLMEKAAHHIEAQAEVIKAAGPLVKRLKALQTYFDLSDEELASMTRDERADTIRQHKLITEVLDAFYRARTDTDAEAALEAVKREARNEALREEEARAHRLRLRL